ncbi:hypothetical protein HY484_03735 [Candidatus Woesearchaeota archaeon]|nr:hypothetical protein [Candidatus Woesearchaeota archaeon]
MKKKHHSHYFERILFSSFIALFAISVFLLLLNIESFTSMASLHTAQIADSCAETLPPSLECSERSECSDSYKQDYVVTRKGKSLCCCMPPPEIRIAVP